MPGLTRALAAAVVALVCLLYVVPAGAQQGAEEDPALAQRIDAAQPVVGDRAVLRQGHVDLGPRFVGGRWKLMVHDDSARAGGGETVWRHPERTVLRVSDAARRRLPDDARYSFLHADPGDPVYVIPETQDRDVVWLGWNTQDPEVMERIDRGVTMTLTAVQGPGDLVVYLQSGSFSDPKVLWDSTTRLKPVWLDVNTHTHANWVFTKPGVYLVQVRVATELLDGAKVADTRELRFAVGTAASTADAVGATWRGAAATSSDDGASAVAAGDADAGGTSWALLAAIVLAAAGLAASLGLLTKRGTAAKREARALAARRVGEERAEDER